MKMKRNLTLAVGLLASILGLSILVDTAMADGCCCCCCGGGGPPCPQEMQSCGQTACLSPATVCKGQSPSNCTQQLGDIFYEVNNFPSSCVPNPGNMTKCDKPLTNCSRTTQCIIGADGTCGTDPKQNGLWQSAAAPTTNPC